MTVQFWELVTVTVFEEPEPLPETMIVVPPEGDGDGEPDGAGEEEGTGLAEGEGVPDGDGVCEGFGVLEGFGVGEEDGAGVIEGEGLGKLAATENLLPKLLAFAENKPKTDWFRAKITRHIKNEVKKYALRIFSFLGNLIMKNMLSS